MPAAAILQAILRRQFDDDAAQPHQLRAHLGRRLAHLGADLNHRLVQFCLDLLAQDQPPLVQDLRDVGPQLARLRIDDLVLFLDADGQ